MGQDSWVWSIDSDGVFGFASTRKWIDAMVLQANYFRTRWCKLVPRKVNIFVWRLLLGRIPITVELVKRGVEIPNVLYPICEWEEETFTHLFVRCEVACKVWEALFKWFDIEMGYFVIRVIYFML